MFHTFVNSRRVPDRCTCLNLNLDLNLHLATDLDLNLGLHLDLVLNLVLDLDLDLHLGLDLDLGWIWDGSGMDLGWIWGGSGILFGIRLWPDTELIVEGTSLKLGPSAARRDPQWTHSGPLFLPLLEPSSWIAIREKCFVPSRSPPLAHFALVPSTYHYSSLSPASLSPFASASLLPPCPAKVGGER